MVLTDEQKIEVCDYWLENPDKAGITEIKGYNGRDVLYLEVAISKGGGISYLDIENYKRGLEKHIMLKESVAAQKKGLSTKRTILIIVVTALAAAFLSNIDRIISFVASKV